MLQTTRLTLRPHRVDDASAWHELQNDPDVLRFLPWRRRTPEESRRHLTHRTRHVRLAQRDDFLALAVEREGELVGDIGLHLREVAEHERTVEISWIIAGRHGRRGFAVEAATAALDLVFDELRVKRVIAEIADGNVRSIALAGKLAFEPLGDQRYLTTPAIRTPTAPIAVIQS